jgi:hypothetical protein
LLFSSASDSHAIQCIDLRSMDLLHQYIAIYEASCLQTFLVRRKQHMPKGWNCLYHCLLKNLAPNTVDHLLRASLHLTPDPLANMVESSTCDAPNGRW